MLLSHVKSLVTAGAVVAMSTGVMLSTAPAADAATATFTNSAAITINDNANATPYPSSVAVSGMTGPVSTVSVTLNGLSHNFLQDVGMVLVAPNGAALLVMDGVGGAAAQSSVTVTVTDSAPSALPNNVALATGSYKPAGYFTNDAFPDPGPGTTYEHPGPTGGTTATFASTFGGIDANGTWKLFVRDFEAQDAGAISGGWSLNVTTAAVTGTPTVSGVTPASPSSSLTPKVTGTAEAGSTVTLYGNASCTGGSLGSGSAADFASPGITATVPADATTTIYAQAVHAPATASACSATSVSYTNDSTPPAAPSGLSVSPDSPSSNLSPTVKGTAEAGSTVTLYAAAGCTGPVASGPAANFASPGLTVLVTEGTTTFSAKATDAAGNASVCSSDTATYVADATAPAAPSGLSVTPASPGASTSPVVKGTAEAGSTVKLYADAACAGSPAATGTSSEFGAGLGVTVSPGSTTSFTATATDEAGNTSACSTAVTYTQQTPVSAPVPDTLLTKTPAKKVKSKKKKAKVVFEFSSTVPGATFTCTLDGKSMACTSGQSFKVKAGKHTFTVVASAGGVVDPTPASYSFKVKKAKKKH
jgi:subtilisin-like proprotein convertase family protein